MLRACSEHLLDIEDDYGRQVSIVTIMFGGIYALEYGIYPTDFFTDVVREANLLAVMTYGIGNKKHIPLNRRRLGTYMGHIENILFMYGRGVDAPERVKIVC